MDQLSLAFHALADPTRRAILMRLAKSDATVNELAEPFDLRLPTISKHLKVLQQASLVSQTREAQRRHCHLESGALKEVAELVWNCRTHWEASFDRLDAFLNDIEAATKASKN